MGNSGSHRDVIAWQKAMDLVEDVYEVSDSFPPDERFALTNQVRRAAVSVPSNIAEGYGRGSRQDYVRFLWIASGSLREVETQIEIAHRLGFITNEQNQAVLSINAETARVLKGLIRSLS